jgi:putative DNA primase/helicase
MTCQRKYRDPFEFKSYAKIILSANELPEVADKNKAFERRIYIIDFNNPVKKPIPGLADKIGTERQINGLAWRLIKVLQELKSRDWVFTINPTIESMASKYEDYSNFLARFIKEECVVDRDSHLVRWELNERFFEWLNKRRLRMWKNTEVNRYMKEKYMSSRCFQDLYDKVTGKFEQKFVHAWKGLKWKE